MTATIAALQAHRLWLNHNTGQRMDCRDATFPDGFNFRRANLTGAILNGATLRRADFSKAELSGTHFSGATLTGARFVRAKCDSETQLRDAILRDCDLTDCAGLNASALAGSDLTGAKLPERLASFEILKTVTEASGQAKTLFLAMLAACAYCWLTIGATKDAALLMNSSSLALPIIQTSIPIVGFYFVAPVLLVLLFSYFHILLHRLWELFGDLPAIFPDGVPVDKRAHPWLLNGLVRRWSRILQGQLPLLAIFQFFASLVLAYSVVPVTLCLFLVRCFPRHDWAMTSIQESLMTGSVGLAFGFLELARAVIARRPSVMAVFAWALPAALVACGALEPFIPFGVRKGVLEFVISSLRMHVGGGVLCLAIILVLAGCLVDLIRRHHINMEEPVPIGFAARRIGLHSFAAVVVIAASGVLAVGAIWGVNDPAELGKDVSRLDARVWVPRFWRSLRYEPFANFRGVDLSLKVGATEGSASRGDLRGADLSHANFDSANLNGVDLSGARLNWASFAQADLGGVNLKGAVVVGADFTRAKGLILPQLERARFWVLSLLPSGYHAALFNEYNSEFERYISGAVRERSFVYSDFSRSDLSHADLRNYNLSETDLRLANLQGADLRGANLWNAKVFLTHFEDCLLDPDEIKKMLGWQLGYYSDRIVGQLGLLADHNHNLPFEGRQAYGSLDSRYDLHAAELTGMDLSGWTFKGTNLSYAKLYDANLQNTSFQAADLSHVEGLDSKVFMTDFREARNFEIKAFTFFVPSETGGVEEVKRCTEALAFLDGQAKHNMRLTLHDLSGADLRHCPLENANLNGFDLRYADLRGANLGGAFIAQSVSMSGRKAQIVGAKLDGTNVRFARFTPFLGSQPMVLLGPGLRRVAWDSDLTPMQAKTASNWQLAAFPSKIEAALLPKDQMHYVAILGRKCRGCQLRRADMRTADVCGSDFGEANLSGANFFRANLQQASLAGADLAGTGFVGAYIAWTDFRGAKNLSAEQIRDARNWSAGYFDRERLADLGLPLDHNESLNRLSGALGVSTGAGCSPPE